MPGRGGHHPGILEIGRVEEEERTEGDQAEQRHLRIGHGSRTPREDQGHRAVRHRDEQRDRPLLPHGIPGAERALHRDVERETEQEPLHQQGRRSGRPPEHDQQDGQQREDGGRGGEPERDRSHDLKCDPPDRQHRHGDEKGAPIPLVPAQDRGEERSEADDHNGHNPGEGVPAAFELLERDREEHAQDLEEEGEHHRQESDSHLPTMGWSGWPRHPGSTREPGSDLRSEPGSRAGPGQAGSPPASAPPVPTSCCLRCQSSNPCSQLPCPWPWPPGPWPPGPWP